MRSLILTGFGLAEYAASAAVALKGLGGDADVAGASKRRLPEMLERIASDVRKVFVLGVALGGDEARLASVLKSLRKSGVSVVWVSAVAASEAQARNVLPFMESVVDDGASLLDVTGRVFGVDVAPFAPYAAEDGGQAAASGYRELFEASQFYYRCYQDEAIYAAAIRMLAEGVRPEAWGEDMRCVVAHYRRYRGRELVGKSLAMRRLRERIDRVASFPDARVLILGESGTGKETVAQLIHNKSPRAREPFCAFNCASVTPGLLESRFFGHEKGAFTGADRQVDGLFDLANGGTLFLDEIGELPPEAQGLLLRVLEGGRFMRVGGREERSADVRLITATNRDLPAQVREGRFRADLYQRLNVVQLRIPPLREHRDDIHDIADGWWFGRHRRHLSEDQIAALAAYDYPGNVRELLNLLDRATVLGEEDFAALVAEHMEMNAGLGRPDVSGGEAPDELDAAMRRHVRRVFDKYGRNAARAAKALKIARNTLKKYL